MADTPPPDLDQVIADRIAEAIDPLQTEIGALTSRVQAAEAGLADHETRIAGLEGAGPPDPVPDPDPPPDPDPDPTPDPDPPPPLPDPPPPNPDPEPTVAEVDIVGTPQLDAGVGPRKVANPSPDPGSGNTIVLMATKPGPDSWAVSENDWVAPAGATPIPGGRYDGVSYVAGYHFWTVPDEGQPEFEFGFSGPYHQTVVAVALNALVDLIVVEDPEISTSETPPYPIADPTVAGMLMLACSVSQSSGDQMLDGPGGPGQVDLVANNTAAVEPRTVGVYKMRATGATFDPHASQWDGTKGAHVQTVVGFGLSTAPPPPPGGPPAERIPTAELVIDVDADDLGSWGKNRPAGNWAIGGAYFEPGQDGDAYGLVWEPDGATIHGSFALPDGSGVERLRPGVHDGLAIIDGATVFVDDGSYGYVPGRFNNEVNTPPSDPLFHDGSRVHLGFPDRRTSVGAAAEPQVVGVSFVSQPWMAADDWTSGPFSLHSPTIYHSGPIALRIRNGRMHMLGRSNGGAPVDPSSTDNVGGSWIAPETWPIPPVGQFGTVVLEYAIDPGGAGYCRWHYLDYATGELVLIAERGNDFGWIFDASHPAYDGHNDRFYPIHQIYNWHRAPSSEPHLNWVGYNVRRNQLRHFTLGQAASVSAERMAGHAKHRLGLV